MSRSTPSRLISQVCFVGIVGLHVLVVSPAHAIIVRDDVSDDEYVVDAADYPAVATLFPPDDCAATLFTEHHLVTVAHCAVDLQTGDSLEVAGDDYRVESVTLHPMWNDGDRYDVAVVGLDQTVANVEPIPLYRGESELGAEVAVVGRGVTATGLQGEQGQRSDGLLRRATNVVTDVDGFLLEVVFEAPGEVGITDLEGVGASGDSGGPVFLVEGGTTYIAGLNAFGDAPAGLGIGEYGSLDYQTRVSRYVAWIDEVVADEPEGTSSSSSGDGSSGDGSSGDGSSGDGLTGSTDGDGESGTAGEPSSDGGTDGCGCSRGGDAPGWMLWAVAIAAMRRRR